jgi:signal transduction histidine kinase
VLPKSAAVEEIANAFSGGKTDPYSEVQRQDADVIRLLEELRQRDVEIESINRELEETNRGVLALYAELDEKAESVRQISNERSRFLSNVTHELRTPLSSITALCRLLLTERDATLGDEQAKQIGYIHKSAQDLLDFVSDLLDLAKVEAGKVAVRPVRFEVDDVLTALRGMFRPLSTDANVPLVFDLSPVPTLETDENKVSQILRNLISNALKFTERGEIRISARHDADRDEVVFVVADTGIGIASADLNRIFDEFVQVDTRRGRRERSSGLGLPLSRKLAQLMGGSITVESEVGRGSTFQVRLPRIYSARAAQPTPRPGDGYILVVDDDHISRYVAKEHLERMGWRVVEAADGDMALKLVNEGGCRAIVLDLVMPGVTGFEVLRRLADVHETAAIPVVVRTSLPASEIDPRSVAHAAAVFSKSDDSIQSLIDFLAAGLAGDGARAAQ